MRLMRMCTVCRAMKDKTELIRVVKNSGKIAVDTENKIQGRGAYICKTGDCISVARKRRALERSLSAYVDTAVYDTLEDLMQNAK